MKAARQVEAVELMIAANTITAVHADALLKATPPEQRADYAPPAPDEPKGDPLEQIVKLEREMNQVQEKYKHAEESYGTELLNLVVAKGYLGKLLANEAVRSYVARHAPEILEQFELVLNTVSMEEAVGQAERREHASMQAEAQDGGPMVDAGPGYEEPHTPRSSPAKRDRPQSCGLLQSCAEKTGTLPHSPPRGRLQQRRPAPICQAYYHDARGWPGMLQVLFATLVLALC